MNKLTDWPGLLACVLLTGMTGMAWAEIYTYLDADGNRVFTDRPKSGNVQRLDMAPTNQMPAPQVLLVPNTPSQPPPLPAYQLLRILFPEPDSSIEDHAGNLMVTLNSDPALRPEHRYRLLLDGEQAGAASRSAVFALENLDRGTHLLAAEIIDSQGNTLERTPSQPVHIRRVSLHAKRKIMPCQLADYGVRPECPLRDKPKPERDIPLIPFI